MQDQSLPFDAPVAPSLPRKRVVRTSVLVAQEMRPVLERRQQHALEAVARWPGLTSGELATGNGAWSASNDAVLAMRIGLSMLKRRGFVEHVPNGARVCRRSGKRCVTWRRRQR